MISSVYLTGSAGPLIDENSRYLMVRRPLPEKGTSNIKYDNFPVVIKNPSGISSLFMKVNEGVLVIVSGRVQADDRANEVLRKHGLAESSMIVIAELVEVYSLEKDMGGYHDFFKD